MLVILGPTGAGKSDLALEVARRTGAQILSVDSMQVYRGMDIGTAKPTVVERAQVPHHLIDVADPNQSFTVARFVEQAEQVISIAASSNTPIVVTGGTPLYYKALFEGLFPGPAADPELRARLGAEDPSALHARLMQVDPSAAARIHLNDRKRLVRAIEVFELTGQPISALQTEWAAASQRYPAVWIGLRWEKETLNRRINSRVRRMLEMGWVEEVRALLATYGGLSATAREATGYALLADYLDRRITLEEAAEQIKIATRQLARRQMKWFRRFGAVRWIDGQASLDTLTEIALKEWRKPDDSSVESGGRV